MELDVFGIDKSWVECEALRTQHIAPNLSELEPALFNSKWFDYRYLHPTQATYLFAHWYKDAMKRAMRRRTDLYKAAAWSVFPKVKVVGESGEFLKKKAVTLDYMDCSPTYITGMWRARQAADKYGVPYQTFCAGALQFHEKQKWARYPLPTALYSTLRKKSKTGQTVPSMMDGILAYWISYRNTHLMASTLDVYQVDKDAPHHYQMAHVEWLLHQIERSSLKVPVVAELVFERRLLRPDWIEEYAETGGKKLLEDAKQFYLLTEGEAP